VDGLSTGGSRFGSGSGFVPARHLDMPRRCRLFRPAGWDRRKWVGPVINVISTLGRQPVSRGRFTTTSRTFAAGATTLTDELESAESEPAAGQCDVIKLQDVTPSVGGPIKKDRLWYFASVRNNRTDQWIPGNYVNRNAKRRAIAARKPGRALCPRLRSRRNSAMHAS
jgi:hypothetical protein